jgi:antitoxin (DNA-binding transcriptional repressor) of toxin-antitoxin stability system
MQIPIENFPEPLQALLQQARQNNTPVALTQSGEPFATITPLPQKTVRPSFGFMKGTGEILGDLVSPVEPS